MAGSPSPAPNVPKLCLLPASHYDPNTSPPATALLPLLFPGALPGRFPFLVLTVVSQKPPWTQAVWASSLGRHARPQPCTSSPSAMHTSLHAHTHYQPLWTGIRLSSGNLEMSSARPLPMEGRTMPLPQFVLILTPRTYAWVLLLCKQGIGVADGMKAGHRRTWMEVVRRPWALSCLRASNALWVLPRAREQQEREHRAGDTTVLSQLCRPGRKDHKPRDKGSRSCKRPGKESSPPGTRPAHSWI